MNITKPFFILSAAQETLNTDEITARTDELRQRIRDAGFPVELCSGDDSGSHETSLLVVDSRPWTDECEVLVMALAAVHSQTYVLAVDGQRQARRLFCDGRTPERIGTFKPVSRLKALGAVAYTERAGRHFACSS